MPLSKPGFRRRLRSVIQDLMYFAARLTKHSNRWGPSLWLSNPWRSAWERVYTRLLRPPDLACGRVTLQTDHRSSRIQVGSKPSYLFSAAAGNGILPSAPGRRDRKASRIQLNGFCIHLTFYSSLTKNAGAPGLPRPWLHRDGPLMVA